MSNCCQLDYDETFNEDQAREELNDYRNKGVVKDSSLPLVKALKRLPLDNHSLADIGGGIGAIVFELHGRGIVKATHIDIADAYINAFREELARRLPSADITSLQGDFLELQDRVSPADLVTLDKVICCYPDYRELVTVSAGKARRWYVYSIPRDVWWVKVGQWFENLMKKIHGRRFPVYVHPTREIEQLVTAAGFHKVEEVHQKEWLVAVFEKQ